MTWTTCPPTEPGWWWYRSHGATYVVHVYRGDGGHLWAAFPGSDRDEPVRRDPTPAEEWAGPLTPPE